MSNRNIKGHAKDGGREGGVKRWCGSRGAKRMPLSVINKTMILTLEMIRQLSDSGERRFLSVFKKLKHVAKGRNNQTESHRSSGFRGFDMGLTSPPHEN